MKQNLCIFFLVILSFSVFSQTSTIRGFVYDKDSKEPIMFCNVFLQGTVIGSATDENGMYIIHAVEPGNYKLTATYIGYDTIQKNIVLTGKQIINQNLEIKKTSIKRRIFQYWKRIFKTTR